MSKLIDTIYWEDFQNYYDNASKLQTLNISSVNGRDTTENLHVNDPLQHYITIYDTVDREFAGFSNAIQQIWHGSANPKQWQIDARFDNYNCDVSGWFWLFLTHRITGSGASFTYDHGFRNSILKDMALAGNNIDYMQDYLMAEIKSTRPLFTSIGNQIPMFPKPIAPFMKASEYYIAEFMPILVKDFAEHVQLYPLKYSIRDHVNWINNWHTEKGLKNFHFVMTAFVMDVAQYFPHLIDPYSQVNYGSNAVKALTLLFKNNGHKTKLAFLDAAMEKICEEFRSPYDTRDEQRNMGKGLSLEDVACDYVRYVQCYIPKGYEHLLPWQVENRSLIQNHQKHLTYINHLLKVGYYV